MSLSPTRATNGNSVHASPAREVARDTPDYQYGRFDASALHIAHALKQTELQKAYHRPREKPIDCYLDRDEQTKLEMKHRQEEDDLYRKFSKHREEENRRIRDEIQVLGDV
ncbi:hillarin-like [Manduca sexta]|uniref:hillarin-like n=1 Tax=Manduca sexta TaxID=7130 RepID=UPI00188F6419|nr:hillarin-like [Manduca sexta]